MPQIDYKVRTAVLIISSAKGVKNGVQITMYPGIFSCRHDQYLNTYDE